MKNPVPRRKLSTALLNLTNISPLLRSTVSKTITNSSGASDSSASPPTSTRPSASSNTTPLVSELTPGRNSTRFESASPSLPIEVVEAILQDLVPESIPFTLIQTSPLWGDTRDYVTPLKTAQLTILHVLQVCKVWFSVGIRLLYHYPHLFTIPQVQAFYATLVAKPSYAGYVRKIFFLDPTRRNPSIIRNPIERIRDDRKAARARKTIRLALNLCNPVDSMHLHIRAHTCDVGAFPVNDAFGPHSIGTHLRQLTLFGYDIGDVADSYLPRVRVFGTRSRHIELPILETLCIRESCLGSTENFPPFHLPKLRTLQLVNCDRTNPGGLLKLRVREFPSLDTLESYDNRCKIVVEDELAKKLERLHLINYDNLQLGLDLFVDSWRLFHGSVRYLALGGPWPRRMYGSIGECRLPAELEMLRIVYQVIPDDPRTEVQSSDILDELYQCLRKSETTRCKEVVFHLLYPESDASGTRLLKAIGRTMEQIKILFMTRNIHLTLLHDGQYGWIHNRLENPQVKKLA